MSSHSYIANPKNEDIFININGELFHRSEAKISVFDSGFLLGDGVWEGIRLHKLKLVFIEDHLDRLYKSAKGIALDIPYSRKDIIDEINKVLLKNKMDDNIHIRLIVSRGDKITPYQNPNANVGPINLVIIPEYKKTDPKTYIEGLNIGRVPNIRPNDSILSPHYNTLSKLNCILASIEANKLGYDEGIMNDMNGNISTCNSTNLFFIKDNTVFTSTGKYCLNGITRGKAILVCNQNNIACSETNFTFENIKNCNEAFVTGTFAGIIPVSQLEGRKLESTNSDSLANKIRMLYNQEIQDHIG
ncbi:MAG: aminotransferase class IV [Flavobacteriaceae bacterium]|nr:aminotransferase class IV [Candidatus Neomarinimicrobiota bacterium]MBT5856768.1 aminotransferase class IV [Flavobacteriaceae bacterium]MBT6839899.1 aminotransferase class IV [Candidatus Neomarinimicrobiota bacterium]MBT7172613.1 aminotransferase class IV [Candidatus Neomarinimicrobiota bacterium]MBT7433686.1 aminotransferase class IV [Candidatus Neomarinimicrobiota bacterium]